MIHPVYSNFSLFESLMEISPTVSISDIKFSVSRKVEDFSRHRKKIRTIFQIIVEKYEV